MGSALVKSLRNEVLQISTPLIHILVRNEQTIDIVSAEPAMTGPPDAVARQQPLLLEAVDRANAHAADLHGNAFASRWTVRRDPRDLFVSCRFTPRCYIAEMSKDVRSKTVDDLDISLRTHGLLKSFGASTVGDVLDLPRIIVPCDWPLKISALVGTELTELFEELGVEYAGEIVFPPLAEAKLIATGDIGARWRTIEEWLKAEHPSALAHWNKPASASAITEVEARLGQILPEEYKQFLSLHDGQRYLAPFVGLGSLLPIADVVMAKQGIFGEPGTVDEDDVGDGVRALDYCAGWIPISRSARGRDYLCIDLDPAPGGTRGQIIEYVVDSNARPLVARSFADLLSEYFTQAQTGEINFDEDDEERE